MDILSFTTIILMLFIIIGCYLIFTSQIEGRAKTIIIIAVFICFIYIFMNLNLFKSYTESKSSPVDAYSPQLVTKVDTTSTSFSLSTWIYITDWNSGINKTIFSMTNPIITTYGPKLTLGPYSNDLVITYYTTPSTVDSAKRDTLNAVLKAYTDAKAAWIIASNNERDATTGNFFSDVGANNTGISPLSTQNIAYSALSDKTEEAAALVTTTRAAYDGGVVGTHTILIPSAKSGATPTTRIDARITESDLNKTTLPGYSSSALKTYNAAKSATTQIEFTEQKDFSKETITIKEISIQKWVNIVISFGDNTVDTYINGKLVDSHVSTGSVQHVSNVANDTTLSWGGFTGYISSSRYYPSFLPPQEAWNIYKAGFSDNLLGNFLNQYNAKFTFSQNQVEKVSFNII
jgi:hypothetical protein